MNPLDRLRVSVRHIRGRLVESILVIAATAVGVALVSAMVAFIGAYDAQTDYLLGHPAYRELLVEVVGNETELDQPVVPYDATVSSEIRLGIVDIERALETAPSIQYGYLADFERLSTATAWQRGGGAGPGGGGALGGGGAVPGAAFGGAFGDAAPPVADDPRGAGRAGRFDIEQFLETEAGVVTELPVETFSGIRTTAHFFTAYGLGTISGTLFTEADVEGGNQVMVLGSELARTLFLDGDPLGTRVRLNLQTYTIIGVLAPSELRDVDTGVAFNQLAYLPNAEAQISFGGAMVRFQRPTRTLRFAVDDSARIAAAAGQLRAHFDAEFGAGTVRITAPIEQIAVEREKLGRILAVVLFLAAAGLFIASINLFNLMLMRVIKRTRGIGITRAIGASRREVFRAFLNESAIMSLTGAAIGLAASPFVYEMLRSSLVASTAEVNLVNWVYLLAGAAGAFVFSLLFGVWPARQAARIDASLAIRTE